MRGLEIALKAAADPTRTRILILLGAGELCVCQIQAVIGLAPSTVSKHLAILKTAGLVRDRRDGRWVHYALSAVSGDALPGRILSLVRESIQDDPRVVDDGRKLRRVLDLPVEVLCSTRRADLFAAAPRPAASSRRGTFRRRQRG